VDQLPVLLLLLLLELTSKWLTAPLQGNTVFHNFSHFFTR
jgi:hypothetical protein